MRVIALGFFDGIHLGHAALLRRAAALASERGAAAACLTFDRHPGAALGRPVPQLNTAEERTWLMRRCCPIDEVLTLPFDDALMHTPWETFAARLLSKFDAVGLVCGADYRFGDRAEGTAELLCSYAAAHGAFCEIVPPVLLDDAPVSSTRIRSALEAGDLEGANRLLGHPHLLSGVVQHGKHVGSQLGFPTANLAIPTELLVPRFGVYDARVTLPDGSQKRSVTNIGLRPTLEQTDRANAESWIQDFSGNLYGQTIHVELLHFLRPEQRFDSVDALRAQVMADAAAVRRAKKEELQ